MWICIQFSSHARVFFLSLAELHHNHFLNKHEIFIVSSFMMAHFHYAWITAIIIVTALSIFVIPSFLILIVFYCNEEMKRNKNRRQDLGLHGKLCIMAQKKRKNAYKIMWKFIVWVWCVVRLLRQYWVLINFISYFILSLMSSLFFIYFLYVKKSLSRKMKFTTSHIDLYMS